MTTRQRAVPVLDAVPLPHRVRAMQLPHGGDSIDVWDEVCAFLECEMLSGEPAPPEYGRRVRRPSQREQDQDGGGLVIVELGGIGASVTARAGWWLLHDLDDTTWPGGTFSACTADDFASRYAPAKVAEYPGDWSTTVREQRIERDADHYVYFGREHFRADGSHAYTEHLVLSQTGSEVLLHVCNGAHAIVIGLPAALFGEWLDAARRQTSTD